MISVIYFAMFVSMFEIIEATILPKYLFMYFKN